MKTACFCAVFTLAWSLLYLLVFVHTKGDFIMRAIYKWVLVVCLVGVASSTALAQEHEESGVPNRIAPPRVGNVLEASARLRAFPTLDAIGAAGLVDASLAYRFSGPFVVGAEVTPIGIGVANTGNALTYDWNVNAGVDTRYFELRLGFGSATVNDYVVQTPGLGGNYVRETGFSSYQRARVGSVDGLNVTFFTRVTTENERFTLSGGGGTIQIPINDDWAFIADASGSNSGYAAGGAGVRYRVFGQAGQARALYVSGTIGGASIHSGEVEYGGPALSGGVEWRQ